LRLGRLFVDKNFEIDGPGAGLLTISAGQRSGVFEITTAPRAQNVRIAGVTIADGVGLFTSSGPEGGGLFNWHADVALSDCAQGFPSGTVTVDVQGTNAPVRFTEPVAVWWNGIDSLDGIQPTDWGSRQHKGSGHSFSIIVG
jgi:hypothetical protein